MQIVVTIWVGLVTLDEDMPAALDPKGAADAHYADKPA